MLRAAPMIGRVVLFAIGILNLFVFGVWTLITLSVAIPAQLLVLPWDPDRRTAAWVARALWGVGMIRGQPFWRLRITGRERVGAGPWIVVSNHQSMLDIPLLMHLPVPVRVVARPGVFRMPVFGQMAAFARHVKLDPSSPETVDAALAHCRHLLDRGISVVLFPEGTRSDHGELLPFHRGAFELALRTGAPVLPVAISGTTLALPKGTPFARARIARFHLQVLEPLAIEGQTRRRLATVARDRIAEALSGPRPWEVEARVEARYLRLGRSRAGWAWGKSRFDPVFWALWERLPRAGVLLDVGCGEGLLAQYLRAAGSALDVVGLDPDAPRLAVARAVADEHMRFEVGDARRAALPEADAVVCIDVLHYLAPHEQDAVLERLCAALRPGGVLFLRDPEPGRGFASWFTSRSEQAMVASGRHVGEGVRVRGGRALAEVLVRWLVDVRVEDCSTGPFANVLVSGRRSG